MNTDAYIAVDFGGGSGRVIAGYFTPDGGLHLDEVHRFGNRQVRLGHHLYWDFPALYAEMLEGLRVAAARGFHISSIGIDTWGVDFGLIDYNGNLLANPICYRDEATTGFPTRFASTRSIEQHYRAAGIQIMDINTIYRLMAMIEEQPHMLQAADKLLMMPDLFSYFLTGTVNCEYTEASTTELLNASTRSWNRELIKSLGLPDDLFPEIVMPGTIRGYLTESVRREIGIDYEVPVVAVGSHDTASAVYASQAGENPDGTLTAFLSSGTWSLLGVRLPEPILNEKARKGGFSNEGGVGGILLLQNITGLWILQQLMNEWRTAGTAPDYPTLIAEARQCGAQPLIDVDDACFTKPVSMTNAIVEWCRSRGLTPPATRGELARCVIQSLAGRYARGLGGLEELLEKRITCLNIIGGGSLNQLLNELTAEAASVEVIAGPAEATAIGNIRLQAETVC